MNKNNRFLKYHLSEIYILILRILIMILLFSISRLGFYLYNTDHFAGITFTRLLKIFAGGLKFDISAIMMINSFYLLLYLLPLKFKYSVSYKKIIKYVFFITNGIALAANTADFFYFDFILKRSTSEEFMFVGQSNILHLFSLFLIDYFQGVIFWAAQLFLMIYLYKKTEKNIRPENFNTKYYITASVFLLISAYFSIIAIRGGFTGTTRPISLGNAGEYVAKPIEMSIVLNTPFTIIRTIGKQPLKEKKYFSDEVLNKIYTPIHIPKHSGAFKNYNIVIFVIESLSREYSGVLNSDLDSGKYTGYLPFLDSLILQSKTFTHAFANGHKSIEALPSVVASIPSMVTPFVISSYATNKITGLAGLLSEKGYQSAFFHGAPNGSMGFSSFMQIAGYQKYFGMTEYNNDDDFDGNWGIWDEEFFQYYADEMNKMKQPFLTTLFSLSSHHPFEIPEKYEGKFKEGPLQMHIPIQYTDMALKKFFAKAQKMSWFKNTIFVITADHNNQKEHPEYKTSYGEFSIPIIFYMPGNPDFKGMDSTIIQQADIMPTLLHLLNYDKKYFAFGNNVFDSTVTHFAVAYTGVYQIIKGDYLMQFKDDKVISLYNYKKDRLQKHNLKGKLPDVQAEMEKLMKAFIQQYNNRMINNSMYVENN